MRKKVQARNGHRAFVKKTIGKARELLEKSPLERSKLLTCKVTLTKQLELIDNLNSEITGQIDADAIEAEILEQCEFDEVVREIICEIESAVGEEAATSSSRSSQDQNAGAPPRVVPNGQKVKLPTLSLPSFSGQASEWIGFWDSFNSTIHDNDQLSDIEKFHYLKSLLLDTAADTISGLQLSSANYKEAVDLLKSRFGNKQVIISQHMDTLMALPSITDVKNLPGLRQMYDKTEAIVRSLRGIDIPPSTYDTFLTPIVMGKVPNELRLSLSRNLADEWDLVELLKLFNEELQLREKCALGPVSPPLPSFRVNMDFAFTSVGVDYAGPLYVRDIYSDSELMNSSYIALFTCASSRALHLELTPDISAEAFIRAFKRFIGRRGFPNFVISDNGKTFKDKTLKNYCLKHGIEWKYNVARAPWWGGFFERLVKAVKLCLKKNISRAHLTFEELSTILVEIFHKSC